MFSIISTVNFEKTIDKKRPSAFFDIDHTIIIPLKGKKMYSLHDSFQWEFMYKNTIEKLKECSLKYTIYFITNQLKFDLIIKERIESMLKLINIEALVLIATGRNKYRKPGIGLIKELYIPGGIPTITKKSFHCGDALGRKSDFSDDDLWFAVNSELRIFSPEEFFDENFKISSFPNLDYNEDIIIDLSIIDKLKSIYESSDGIMIMGLPGSGKTSIRKWFIKNYKNLIVYNNDEKLDGKIYNIDSEYKNFYILDNTNLTNIIRNLYPSFLKLLNIKIIFIDLESKDCIRGIKYRNFTYGGLHIPDVVIHTMNKRKEIPDNISLHLTKRPILDITFPQYLIN